MLTITDSAELVLRKIPEQYADPRTAGLRIALAAECGDRLQVRAVPSPEPDDQVVEFDGARIFLGPVAARRLSGKQLDADLDARGRIQFRTRRGG